MILIFLYVKVTSNFYQKCVYAEGHSSVSYIQCKLLLLFIDCCSFIIDVECPGFIRLPNSKYLKKKLSWYISLLVVEGKGGGGW